MKQNHPTAQLLLALTPLVVLMLLLWFNVGEVYGDDALSGSNQVILMLAAFVAAVIGVFNGSSVEAVFAKIKTNIHDTTQAIFILILIGGLAGTWLLGGVVPAMIYYGLDLINVQFFLPTAVIISALISLSTGSSWSTTATVGIALMGIGQTIGIPAPVVAGAVISGAYFGDKLSPLSDTTNLAPAMAGTDLFTHIRYMLYTTVPSLIIALILFTVLGLGYKDGALDAAEVAEVQSLLSAQFNITPWLFLVPAIVILLISRKIDALVAISVGIFSGLAAALVFQQPLLQDLGTGAHPIYEIAMRSIYGSIAVPSEHPILSDLLSTSGMSGMLGTVWLILSAMAFGGAMEASGFLATITNAIIRFARGSASLITSTLVACGILNVTASDQYLAIVVPGRMFKDVYRERGLAPENLSRTLEDSGTVTSVLVPWNTCGAYQSSVLGVATGDYFMYAFFNLISPIMTLIYAWVGIRIKKIQD
ncbi:MAG: Na+/H+ antiporter NhaC [Schleiferiaceae bacterium]|jgi:NhaC family Na+:H+ antiporter|nr:Na+/H+ antiporter NhaC [Bacteroidota bacterium]MCH1406762.1 Na+/H+ antiporter NhaC [Schleiferiaceae bacterium]MDB9838365.1 Na+/H+ antiporter NhaC [bacterium]HAR22248.1 Na+/H+ antiporter NhaC [Cryomorphaceae bacterium]MBT6365540.1 Na+/H+ antiporter NhaC [Bacteroidota bacterium]